MSDVAIPASSMSIKNTTIAAGGGGYVLLIADYASDCMAAGHFTVPGRGLIVMSIALLAPIAHLVGRIVINRLQKLAGDTA